MVKMLWFGCSGVDISFTYVNVVNSRGEVFYVVYHCLFNKCMV